MSISFKRPFQLWAYTVSHSQLLLRSPKDADYATRVDVLFKPVVLMKVPSRFAELMIVEADAQAVGVSPTLAADRRVWLLSGAGVDAFVIADVMAIREDDAEYWEPSKFDIEIPSGS